MAYEPLQADAVMNKRDLLQAICATARLRDVCAELHGNWRVENTQTGKTGLARHDPVV